MEEDPVFQRSVKPLATAEARAVAFRQTRRMFEYDFPRTISSNDFLANHWAIVAAQMYDISLSGVYLLTKSVSFTKIYD